MRKDSRKMNNADDEEDATTAHNDDGHNQKDAKKNNCVSRSWRQGWHLEVNRFS